VAWLLAVLAVLAAVVGVLISPDRSRATRQLGIGLLAGGFAVVVLLVLGREIAQRAAPAGRSAAVGAVWGAFLGGLRVQALWLAAAGAACVGAASGHLRRVGVEARFAQGWGLFTGAGTTPGRRLAGAIALTAAGLLILFDPTAALTIAAQAAGLYVLYKGVQRVLSVVVADARNPRAVIGVQQLAVGPHREGGHHRESRREHEQYVDEQQPGV
jgi:hypothetical protein